MAKHLAALVTFFLLVKKNRMEDIKNYIANYITYTMAFHAVIQPYTLKNITDMRQCSQCKL